MKCDVYILGMYLISYDIAIEVEFFRCEQYHGISFLMEEGRYDVLCNKDMGYRITINLKDGSWNDIPFKPATFGFLPKGVTAQEIG